VAGIGGDVSDFNIQVKVRNARLLRAIRAHSGTAAEFSRASGVNQTAISALLSMRLSPLTKAGEWTTTVHDICTHLGCMPEEIWPKHMERVLLKRAETEIELSSAEVEAITEGAADRQQQREMLARWIGKSGLVDRDVEVLALRIEGATLEECAQEVGTTRERIRQREMRALRRLREMARRDGIRTFTDVVA
jgi:DNA-binding CsgD family transcriptional regulator/lambda repressor-like predicted transcriptional regulator